MANRATIFSDYTSRDYVAYRSDMLAMKATLLPEWTSSSPSDFGVVLIELFAWMGDNLSFYGDRIANEAFLLTAVQRSSVLNIAQMLDYRPRGNIAARTVLSFTLASTSGAVTIPAGTQVIAQSGTSGEPVIFETDAALIIGGTVNNVFTGAVTATQGETIAKERIGTSTGGIDQQFPLFRSPVIEGSVDVHVNEGLGAIEWQYVSHLIDAHGDQPSYTLRTDENGVVYVIFGDNVNGRIPAVGAAITATYRVGGGSVGNLGPSTLTQPMISIPGVIAVTNPSEASGGTDAETIDEIRINAPRGLRTLERGVTLDDYSELAFRSDPLVGRAQAVGALPTNITIYIAPAAGGVADASLRTRVLAYLQPRKTVGTTINLADPTYVPVNITANVEVDAAYNREQVRTRALTEMQHLLAFESVGFGTRIPLALIYSVLQQISGVVYATVTVLSRTNTGVGDIVTANNEIPQAGTITITATGGTGG